jgi:hypothetical protein
MRGTVFLAPLLLGVCWEQAHADMPVDVALVLATDISASVDAAEYRMQMAGLAAAIASEPVLEAIAAGPTQEDRRCRDPMVWPAGAADHHPLDHR